MHSLPHGHVVIRGRTRCEIEGRPTVERSAADGNLDMPANIKHQITALEDDTIYINIMALTVSEARGGGVMLETGEVVYAA
jgi:hypothetical protein